MTLAERTALLLMVLMAALLAWNLWLRGRLLHHLRVRHSRLWESLGSPTLILNSSFENGARVLSFIWSNRCESLEDADLAALVRRERLLHVLQAVVFLAALAAVAAHLAS